MKERQNETGSAMGQLKILIVGGGVCGPALGLALKRIRGDHFDVTIIESHRNHEGEIGSYFTLQDNGAAILEVLGVLQAVRDAGVDTTSAFMRNGDGASLLQIPFGNSVTVKRCHVNNILMDAAAKAGCMVRYGVKIVGARAVPRSTTHDTRRVTALLDGPDGNEEEAFDLIAGCDGVHSTVRRLIDPSAPLGRYIGLLNHAGVAPMPSGSAAANLPTLVPNTWYFCFGRNAFILYHVGPKNTIVWGVNEPAERLTKEQREQLDSETLRKRLLALFAADADPMIPYLFENASFDLLGDPQCDVATVPRWFDDLRTMVLLGDAIHAPAPTSGQGGSMALEDAVVLAKALCESPSIESALDLYEQVRRRRVEKIVAYGASMSKTKMPGRFGRWVRDLTMPIVAKCVDFEKLNGWIVKYRIAWDQPLLEQVPAQSNSNGTALVAVQVAVAVAATATAIGAAWKWLK